MESKRTKGEWYYEPEAENNGRCDYLKVASNEDDHWIAQIQVLPDNKEQAQANAEFICKAVNNHDKLVEALKELLEETSYLYDSGLKENNTAQSNAKHLLSSLEK